MLLLIAWRNIWRNKTRSLILMASITVGIWAGLTTTALNNGMGMQIVESSIATQTSHIQIHEPGFMDNKEIDKVIPDRKKVLNTIGADPEIAAVTARVVTTGMAASPVNSAGVLIKGIIPSQEKEITDISRKVTSGTYFNHNLKNPVLLGKKLSEKLNVNIRSKIVITTVDKEGTLTTGAFRVTGIFKTNSSNYDESTIFVLDTDLRRLTGLTDQVHEIAILLKTKTVIDSYAVELKKAFPLLKIETWKQLQPELEYISDIMEQMLYIFMVVILLAMAFGIVNTMLMAVIDRVYELGMLIAVGMARKKIFLMILLETVLITITGATAGLVIELLTLKYLTKTGINLAFLSEGLSSFGIGDIIYPALSFHFYFNVSLMVILTAVISAVYPAYRALKLKPAEAIRRT